MSKQTVEKLKHDVESQIDQEAYEEGKELILNIRKAIKDRKRWIQNRINQVHRLESLEQEIYALVETGESLEPVLAAIQQINNESVSNRYNR